MRRCIRYHALKEDIVGFSKIACVVLLEAETARPTKTPVGEMLTDSLRVRTE